MTRALLQLRLLGFVALLSASALLRAQQPLASAQTTQLVSFFMVGGKEVIMEGDKQDSKAKFKFRTEQSVNDLDMSPGQVSGPFQRKVDPTIQIYREQPAADPAKPPVSVLVAKVEVPTAWRNIMILVTAGEEGEVRLKPIDQSMATIPPGHVCFINLTRVPLAVKLGNENGIAQPQDRVVLTTGITGDQAQMVKLLVAAEIEGEGRVINSASAAIAPNERGLVLLYPGKIRPVQVLFLPSAPADPKLPAELAKAPLALNKTVSLR